MNSATILASLVFDAFAELRETAEAVDCAREQAMDLLNEDLSPTARQRVFELIDEFDKLFGRLDGYASYNDVDVSADGDGMNEPASFGQPMTDE